MAISDADLWHQVHAEREDGVPTMFLVRDIAPRPDQPRIFVIEMPYPITDLSKLPDAASYRRLDTFQEQWVEPACEALGWTYVASKSADGSIFLYLYGDGDPDALLEKLAPFDGSLGFFSDVDADWSEYTALRELVDQAEAAGETHVHTEACELDDASLDDASLDDASLLDDVGDADDTSLDLHDGAREANDTSDGVPVGIPVIDLSAEAVSRKMRARAQTVDLGRPGADRASRAQALASETDDASPDGVSPSKARSSKARSSKAASKSRASKAGPTKASKAPPRASASKATPSKAAASKASPSKATPGKASPRKASPSKASPSKASPSKAAASKASPSKASPSKATRGKAAASKAGAKTLKPTAGASRSARAAGPGAKTAKKPTMPAASKSKSSSSKRAKPRMGR